MGVCPVLEAQTRQTSHKQDHILSVLTFKPSKASYSAGRMKFRTVATSVFINFVNKTHSYCSNKTHRGDYYHILM